jgi:hypothetical protein
MSSAALPSSIDNNNDASGESAINFMFLLFSKGKVTDELLKPSYKCAQSVINLTLQGQTE